MGNTIQSHLEDTGELSSELHHILDKLIPILRECDAVRTRHRSVNRKTEPISDILRNRHRRRYFKNRKPTKNNRKNRYSRLFSYLPKPLFCLYLQ